MAGSAAARLTLELVTDARKATKGIDDTERRFSRLGSSIGKVGKLAAGGLAVGLGAAAVGAFKLAQGAAEDEAGAKRLERALINTTGATKGQVAAVEDWITKQGQALGVTDDELRPALGRLAAATGDVGKAQKLASLAMNISAGTGKSLEAVSTALAKAQNGNVSALGKFGVATKDAAGKTLSLDAITGKLAQTYKGQASTAANTAAGKFGRLKLRLAEAGESIGAKLLPLGNKLAAWALKMAPRVEKLAGELGRKLGPTFRAVGSFISDKAVPAAQAFVKWFIERIAPGIARTVTPIINGLRAAFAKVADKVAENRPQLVKLGNALKDVAEFIVRRVAPVVGKILGKAFEGLGTSIGLVIDFVSRLVDGFVKVKNAVQDFIDALGRIKVPKIKLPDLNPLNRSAGVDPFDPSAYAGAGPSVVVNVTGALDPDSVARQVAGILNARSVRLTGRPAFA